MFTGLVQDVGKLLARTDGARGSTLRIGSVFEGLELGESVAVMGVCLTVHRIFRGGFEAQASLETLQKTTLLNLRQGQGLHLERALRLTDRLGGHLVAGHVDVVGTVASRSELGDAVDLAFGVEPSIAPFLAEKGSIAVDGVSLTINEVSSATFHVAVVPHTQHHTLLGDLQPGAKVNLEADLLARYVVRWLQMEKKQGQISLASPDSTRSDQSLLSRLASSGYL